MTLLRCYTLVAIAASMLLCSAVDAQLTLNVDVGTGSAQITNAGGTAVSFDGYSISSPGGHLNGAWSSLESQELGGWDVADNSGNTRATELNPMGVSELAPGEFLDLGAPYDPTVAPTALGEMIEDLSFVYTLPGNDSVLGDVNYKGPINNVVLAIDPATGEATIRNRSSLFNVAIDGYTITSGSGALTPGNWNSLQDQGVSAWDEADNSNAFRITELNPTGESQLDGGGTTFDLGAILDVSGGVSVTDVEFHYLVADGETMAGTISLGAFAASVCTVPEGAILGDLNLDGEVGFPDFLILSGNFNTMTDRYEDGDIDCDGTVAFPDFLALSGNFGTTAGNAAASVPEPASAPMLGLAGLGVLLIRQRRSRRESR